MDLLYTLSQILRQGTHCLLELTAHVLILCWRKVRVPFAHAPQGGRAGKAVALVGNGPDDRTRIRRSHGDGHNDPHGTVGAHRFNGRTHGRSRSHSIIHENHDAPVCVDRRAVAPQCLFAERELTLTSAATGTPPRARPSTTTPGLAA